MSTNSKVKKTSTVSTTSGFISFSDVMGSDTNSMSNNSSFSSIANNEESKYPTLKKMGYTASSGLAPIYTGDDIVLSNACKKLIKKDIVTKLKGLDELRKWIDSRDIEHNIAAFLPHYSYLFLRLGVDTNAQIRTGLCQILHKLVVEDKRAFGPFMKAIIGPWWVLCEDECSSVASAAVAAFEAAIPPKKRPDVLMHLSSDLIGVLTANINSRPEELSDTAHCSPEEVQERFELVVSSSLAAVGRFISSIPSESICAVLGLENQSEKKNATKTIIDIIWNKTKHKRSSFRKASYIALRILFQCLPNSTELVVEYVLTSMSDKVLGLLDERNDDSIQSMMALLVTALRHIPRLWQKLGVEVVVIRLTQLLVSIPSQMLMSTVEKVIPQLSLLVGSIPSELISSRSSNKKRIESEHQTIQQARSVIVDQLIKQILTRLASIEEDTSLISSVSEKFSDQVTVKDSLQCNLMIRCSIIEMSIILLLRRVPSVSVAVGADTIVDVPDSPTDIPTSTLSLFNHLIIQSTTLIQFIARYCSDKFESTVFNDLYYSMYQSESNIKQIESPSAWLLRNLGGSSLAPILTTFKSLQGVLTQLQRATVQGINYSVSEWDMYFWSPLTSELLTSELLTSVTPIDDNTDSYSNGSSSIGISKNNSSIDNGLVVILSALLVISDQGATHSTISSPGLHGVSHQMSASIINILTSVTTIETNNIEVLLSHIRFLLFLNPIDINTSDNNINIEHILRGFSVPLMRRLFTEFCDHKFCCYRHDQLSCEIGVITHVLLQIRNYSIKTPLSNILNDLFSSITDSFVQFIVEFDSMKVLQLIEYSLSVFDQLQHLTSNLEKLFNQAQVNRILAWQTKVVDSIILMLEGNLPKDQTHSGSILGLTQIQPSDLIRFVVGYAVQLQQSTVAKTYVDKLVLIFKKLQYTTSMSIDQSSALLVCHMSLSIIVSVCGIHGLNESLFVSSKELTALICYSFFSCINSKITSTLLSSKCISMTSMVVTDWKDVQSLIIPSLSLETFESVITNINASLGEKSAVNKFSVEVYTILIPRVVSLINAYSIKNCSELTSYIKQSDNTVLQILQNLNVFSYTFDSIYGDSLILNVLSEWSNAVLRYDESEVKEILDVVSLISYHDMWTPLVYRLNAYSAIFNSKDASVSDELIHLIKTTLYQSESESECSSDYYLNGMALFLFKLTKSVESFVSELNMLTMRPILSKLLACRLATDEYSNIDGELLINQVSEVAVKLDIVIQLCRSILTNLMTFVSKLGFNNENILHVLSKFNENESLPPSSLAGQHQGLMRPNSFLLTSSINFIDYSLKQLSHMESVDHTASTTEDMIVLDCADRELDSFEYTNGMRVFNIDVNVTSGKSILREGEIVGVHKETGEEPYYTIRLKSIHSIATDDGDHTGSSINANELQTESCKLITYRDDRTELDAIEIYTRNTGSIDFKCTSILQLLSENSSLKLDQLYALKLAQYILSQPNGISSMLLRESRRPPPPINVSTIESICKIADHIFSSGILKEQEIASILHYDLQQLVTLCLDTLIINKNVEYLNLFVCTIKLFKCICNNRRHSSDKYGFGIWVILNLIKVKSFTIYLSNVSKLVLPAIDRLTYVTELCSLSYLLLQSVKSYYVYSFSLFVVETTLKLSNTLQQSDKDEATVTVTSGLITSSICRLHYYLFSCAESLQLHCSSRVKDVIRAHTYPRSKLHNDSTTSSSTENSNTKTASEFSGIDIELFMYLLQHFVCDTLTSTLMAAAVAAETTESSQDRNKSLTSADAILSFNVRHKASQYLHLFLLGRSRQAIVELAVKSSLQIYKDALLVIVFSDRYETEWTRIVACKLLDILFASAVDAPSIAVTDESNSDLGGSYLKRVYENDAEKVEVEEDSEADEIEKDRRVFQSIIGDSLLTQLYARLPQAFIDTNINSRFLSSHLSTDSLSILLTTTNGSLDIDSENLESPVTTTTTTVPPNDTANNDLLGLTLLWLLILQRVEATSRVHMGVGSSCSSHLKRSGLFADMISIFMRSMHAIGDGEKDLSNFFQRFVPTTMTTYTNTHTTPTAAGTIALNPNKSYCHDISGNDLKTLCTYALFRSVCYFPSLTRQHWSDNCSRTEKKRLGDFIQQRVYKALVSKEIALIALACRSSFWNPEELSVRGSVASGEVVAVYTKEDAKVEIKIILPPEYPLKNVEVEYVSKLGVSEERLRRWKLQIIHLLKEQDGAVIDAILLWKRNVEKEFEGVEPCPICYNVLDLKTNSLPNLQCSICSNRFHKQCLNTWFKQSGKNKCVLCQQPFRSVALGSASVGFPPQPQAS